MSNEQQAHGPVRGLVERAMAQARAQGSRFSQEPNEHPHAGDRIQRLLADERGMDTLRTAADRHDAQVAQLVAAATSALDALTELVGADYDVTGELAQLRAAIDAMKEADK